MVVTAGRRNRDEPGQDRKLGRVGGLAADERVPAHELIRRTRTAGRLGEVRVGVRMRHDHVERSRSWDALSK